MWSVIVISVDVNNWNILTILVDGDDVDTDDRDDDGDDKR